MMLPIKHEMLNSTLMVVALSVVVMAALSTKTTINITFFTIFITVIITPEETHAASQDGQHAEKLHLGLSKLQSF